MTNPLHASYYADRAVQRSVAIVEQQLLARDTYRLRFACREIAERITPGQFLMVRIGGCNDPLIGRALALYDTHDGPHGRPELIDVVYAVHGKFTSQVRRLTVGQSLDVWGPLGNGFPPPVCDDLILVAGGIGQTPFPAVIQEALGLRSYGDEPRGQARVERVVLCYGARSAEYLAGLDDFERCGADVRLATDDGTRGHHGLVTDLLEQALDETEGRARQVYCCGPERMMEAAAAICARRGAECLVSLETPMACGIGICFTCVAKVKQADGSWDYKRTCVEGPVFAAAQLEW